jgi:hypothetical protein
VFTTKSLRQMKQETIQRYVEAVGREKFLAVFNKQDH